MSRHRLVTYTRRFRPRMAVTISGVRAAKPARFQSIQMRFEIHGVGEPEARQLVEVWRER